MFITIIGVTTPPLKKRDEKVQYIKAMSFAVVLDVVIYYTLILWMLK